MPFVQCPRCCKPLPSSANYCRRCGLPQNRPTERVVVTPPRKTSGGGLRVLFFCILLILLLKALAWKASKPVRTAPPRFDRSDSSWRYEHGTTKQRFRSMEREVIGHTEAVQPIEPVEREEDHRADESVHDRHDH